MIFGDYTPDFPDRENGVTIAKNVIPGVKSYRQVGSLTAITNALDAACLSAIAAKDYSGNVFNYAATASKIYLLSNNIFTSANLSKTGTDISFTASTGIGSTSTDLSVFGDDQIVTVTGSANNNADHTISGSPTSTAITTSGSPAIVNESAGSIVTIERQYSTIEEDRWEFAQWGNKVIATNLSDPVQIVTMGLGNVFDDLAGSPPKARHVAVIRNFVVLGNLVNYPNRIHWSAIEDETGWTAGTNLSDTQDFLTGGAVQRILNGESGIVFLESAIYRLTYEGLPFIFRVDQVEARGTPSPWSVAQLGSGAFYLGIDSFYFFDGSGSTDIGTGKVAKTFYADLDQDYFHNVVAAIDPINTIVFWAYPGVANVGGRANKIIAYNYNAGRWAGPIEVGSEFIYNGISQGATLDGLDSLYATIDEIEVSLDSRYWQGGAIILSAFNSSHKLCTFTGSALTATIETGEYSLNPMGRAMVTGVIPNFDGVGTATMQIGTRYSVNDSVSWSMQSSQEPQTQQCNFRVNNRYHRFRLNVEGGFSHIYGLDPVFNPVGKK